MFFVALHDLGKLDVRFQLKAPEVVSLAWRQLEKGLDHEIVQDDIQCFDHGRAGMVWGYRELAAWVDSEPEGARERWTNWLAAVTGHHGDYYEPSWPEINDIEADESLIEHDHAARRGFVVALETLFLVPAGLTLQDLPPACSLPARALLAGFCAVCDWIGSNSAEFKYRSPGKAALALYFSERQEQVRGRRLLERSGIVADSLPYEGLGTFLGKDESPRGVQTEIDGLPAVPGLTLIEAPTGSGKTEAVLAYSWRLLEAGVADSIVFALPTQATANAMLKRIEAFAVHVFGRVNLVLAHGKREFNEGFQQLIERGLHLTAQGKEEASVQCAAWLANSRKLVFLGQIGVCTIDQVLLSVLPVRHKFMRGFGLGKSVLIVDEVHAYDAYMYGLLCEVLKNQRACGGSAILLSATLPAGLRDKLLGAWNAHGQADAPYPALWHGTGGETVLRTMTDEHRPPRREVGIECLKLAGAYPDDTLLSRIVAAAESGALVGVVVNLVDHAQRLARALREHTWVDVDIFHARYRFADRQEKEEAVLEYFGRNAARTKGRILVATQVVEQSLDLDFDWLITQICPVDLLFQRLGRLHRHQRDQRPQGFESPRCAVMTVEGDDYGIFELIYGNARVLWRTQQLLERGESLVFPDAYREWIELVYQREDWDAEPKQIAVAYDAFHSLQLSREKDAQRLTTMTVSSFRDEDERITGLTRDGEMSLNVLPVTDDGRFVDGRSIAGIAECDLAEALNLNVIPCPASWKNRLGDCHMDKDGPLSGLLQLEVTKSIGSRYLTKDQKLEYSREFGLEKIAGELTRSK